MKTSIVSVLTGLVLMGRIMAQGDLTPPGPPAPTMKTLDQIEARTPLAGGTSTITISAPGSYYLTGNVTVTGGDGIVIEANHVTLDLNGFTVATTNTATNTSGILLSRNRPGFSVRNGSIRGTVTFNGTTYSGGGFDYGVIAGSSAARVADLTVTGMRLGGILASLSLVESCVVRTIGFNGITGGTVARCRVSDCGSYGILAFAASGCSMEGAASVAGMDVTTADDCYVVSTGAGPALRALTASGCYGRGSSRHGISTFTATTVTGSTGTSVQNRGITAEVVSSSSGTCVSSGVGLSAAIANSCVGVHPSAASVSASFIYIMP